MDAADRGVCSAICCTVVVVTRVAASLHRAQRGAVTRRGGALGLGESHAFAKVLRE